MKGKGDRKRKKKKKGERAEEQMSGRPSWDPAHERQAHALSGDIHDGIPIGEWCVIGWARRARELVEGPFYNLPWCLFFFFFLSCSGVQAKGDQREPLFVPP